jgi:hypothetical protein
MGSIIKEETIKFVDGDEYESVKKKLINESAYGSTLDIVTVFDDNRFQMTYKTEEIVPRVVDADKIKVLLLFKNPHPDSVHRGLYLSEPSSKTFWNRFFEVKFNENLLPLLKSENSWITKVADALTSGDNECEFLYYFRCLYSFPTKQFNDLTNLFSLAPRTYRQEVEKRSIRDFWEFIKEHKIKNVIIFFIDGMRLLAGMPSVSSRNAIQGIKGGIDKYICCGKENVFWEFYGGLKVTTSDKVNFYFNMNTRTKNHGSQLPKRYFTYNLEFILEDMLNAQDHKREGIR